MNTIKPLLTLLLTCLGVSAATPSFSSFNTNQFSTNNLFISIKDGAAITNLNVITDLFINSTNIVNLFAPSSVTNGAGGDSIWTNITGYVTMIPGQTTTNTLAFASGAADNATNIALRVGTASNWNGASKLISLETQNTNIFSVNTLATVTLNGRTGQANFIGQMDSGAYFELWADDFDRYFAMSTADGNDVLTYLAPTVASSGTAVAYLLDTSNTLTNGDKFVSIGNAGTEVLNISPNSTGAQIVFGPGSTNVLYRSGVDLVYTNGATTPVYFKVQHDGGAIRVGASGSTAQILADTSAAIGLAPDNGSTSFLVTSTGIYPTDASKTLGTTTANNQWFKLFLGGTLPSVVWNGTTNTVFDTAGAGDPNGSVTADIGSTYRNFTGGAGTSFYVKESNNGGNTGWVGK